MMPMAGCPVGPKWREITMPLCIRCGAKFASHDRFCSSCGTAIDGDLASQHYERAMDASNPDVIIRELDECLCAEPLPDLPDMAMYAYFNMSAAIWEKFQFNDRKGATIDDDEYVWVNACRLCIHRVLEIHEHMPREQQLEANVVKIHHAAKQHLDLTMLYGAYVVSPGGQRRFREISSGDLPPLRSLKAPLGNIKTRQQEARPDNCPACGAANRGGFSFCRKCGSSRSAPATSSPTVAAAAPICWTAGGTTFTSPAMGSPTAATTAPAAAAQESPLISMIKADAPAVCIGGAEQAGQQRLRAAVPALIELMLHKGPAFEDARKAAAAALGEIGDLRALNWVGEASYHELLGDGMESFAVTGQLTDRLINQPGGRQYAAQLQGIVMYHMVDFFRSTEIHIDPDVQNRPVNPFTMQSAKRFFFQNFAKESFYFEGKVGSIVIRYAEDHLPGHSFAGGWLYPVKLDELGRASDLGATPDPAGKIHFRFGGEVTIPMIEVTPEPNWPRPSIVRRQAPGRVWFEELV